MGHPSCVVVAGHCVPHCCATHSRSPDVMLRILVYLLLLVAVTAMPSSLESQLFCYVPTPAVSAAFAKSMAMVEYAAASLASAASDVKAS